MITGNGFRKHLPPELSFLRKGSEKYVYACSPDFLRVRVHTAHDGTRRFTVAQDQRPAVEATETIGDAEAPKLCFLRVLDERPVITGGRIWIGEALGQMDSINGTNRACRSFIVFLRKLDYIELECFLCEQTKPGMVDSFAVDMSAALSRLTVLLKEDITRRETESAHVKNGRCVRRYLQ